MYSSESEQKSLAALSEALKSKGVEHVDELDDEDLDDLEESTADDEDDEDDDEDFEDGGILLLEVGVGALPDGCGDLLHPLRAL